MKIRQVAAHSSEQLRTLEHIEKAVREFARLGCDTVNALCNERRKALLSQVDRAFLDGRGLRDLAPEQAMKELAPAFALSALPEELEINFSVHMSEFPGRPMGALRPTIWIYMSAIDAEALFCPTIQLGVEDATLHEMLHICGDVEGDGIVRHNWAGIEPIREALRALAT